MALIPLKDDNPLKRIRFQYVTVALIAACVGVFVWQLSLGEGEGRAIYGLGTVPAVLLGTRALDPGLVLVPAWATLFTSMFLHGGLMHIGGNMLYLWIFGDNVEDSMGHGRFLAFYLVTGVIAALAHVASNADSTIPTIGASGAISGVLGAYLVLHPKARVLTIVLRFPVRLPAWVVLGVWIGLQFLNAAMDGGSGGGVAWWAHIGGFVAGAVLIVPFRRKSVPLFDGLAPPLKRARSPKRKPEPHPTRGRRSRFPESGRRRR